MNTYSGIYITWEEAEKQVKGFSGAVYKSFKTYIEAEEFLNSRSLEL
ncbi:ribonuclease H1 domain-containing protein [Streptococcus sanguinis]|nr:RNase H1/viroplasmin domain-containing protein [Streptococcus sanguinis]